MDGKTRVTHDGPGGIRLVLDGSEVFPDDPGRGTPAMVYLPSGEGASYWCATNEQHCESKALTAEQCAWLDGMENEVEALFAGGEGR